MRPSTNWRRRWPRCARAGGTLSCDRRTVGAGIRAARRSRRLGTAGADTAAAAVLQLIAEGHGTRQIAERLYLSVKTVETHRAQIMQRLGIHDVPGS